MFGYMLGLDSGIYIHIYSYIHTHIFIYINIYIHTYIHTYILLRIDYASSVSNFLKPAYQAAVMRPSVAVGFNVDYSVSCPAISPQSVRLRR